MIKRIINYLFPPTECGCNWLIACNKCSARLNAVDQELRRVNA